MSGEDLIPFFCSLHLSQNSGTDNWNGFGNDDFEKPSKDSYQTSSSKVSSASSRNTASLSAKQPSNDFSSLDVKASKPKIGANKVKSVEDDAWNLLNN